MEKSRALGFFLATNVYTWCMLPLRMNLLQAMVEFVSDGRVLLTRLRSEEANDIEDSELHILRVQLFQIDNVAANLQEFKRQHLSKTATTEVDDEMPRLVEPFLPPITSPVAPPAEPV